MPVVNINITAATICWITEHINISLNYLQNKNHDTVNILFLLCVYIYRRVLAKKSMLAIKLELQVLCNGFVCTHRKSETKNSYSRKRCKQLCDEWKFVNRETKKVLLFSMKLCLFRQQIFINIPFHLSFVMIWLEIVWVCFFMALRVWWR